MRKNKTREIPIMPESPCNEYGFNRADNYAGSFEFVEFIKDSAPWHTNTQSISDLFKFLKGYNLTEEEIAETRLAEVSVIIPERHVPKLNKCHKQEYEKKCKAYKVKMEEYEQQMKALIEANAIEHKQAREKELIAQVKKDLKELKASGVNVEKLLPS